MCALFSSQSNGKRKERNLSLFHSFAIRIWTMDRQIAFLLFDCILGGWSRHYKYVFLLNKCSPLIDLFLAGINHISIIIATIGWFDRLLQLKCITIIFCNINKILLLCPSNIHNNNNLVYREKVHKFKISGHNVFGIICTETYFIDDYKLKKFSYSCKLYSFYVKCWFYIILYYIIFTIIIILSKLVQNRQEKQLSTHRNPFVYQRTKRYKIMVIVLQFVI